jgi:hypothetical protein
MKPGAEPPWLVFDFEHQAFHCKRCGRAERVTFPVDVKAFTAGSNEFAEVHATCTEVFSKPVGPTTFFRRIFEGRGDMQAQLVGREGGHIVTVEMPPFAVLPEIIVWGTRHFQLKTLRANDLVYVEVFAWAVPKPRA